LRSCLLAPRRAGSIQLVMAPLDHDPFGKVTLQSPRFASFKPGAREVAIPCVPEQPRLQHHLGEFLDIQGTPSVLLRIVSSTSIGSSSEVMDHCGGLVAV
jgi:hypothetical protein